MYLSIHVHGTLPSVLTVWDGLDKTEGGYNVILTLQKLKIYMRK